MRADTKGYGGSLGCPTKVNKVLRIAGILACSLSLLAMSGGHLFALQSLAWVRMVIEYSRNDSIQNALAKTFSGEHPCALCLKVQKSWNEKQKQESELPLLASESFSEAVWVFELVTIPEAPTAPAQPRIFDTDFFYSLSGTPPKPPPRA